MLKDDDDVIINVVRTSDIRKPSKAQIKKEKFAERFLKKKQSRSKSKNGRGLGNMYNEEKVEEKKEVAQKEVKVGENEQQKEGQKEKGKEQKQGKKELSKEKTYKYASTAHQPQTPAEYTSRKSLPPQPTPTQLLPTIQPLRKPIATPNLQQSDLHPHLLSALQTNNIHQLTPIQQLCLAPIRNGSNCIVKAQTGSGKTLAYLIPLVDNLLKVGIVKSREHGSVIIVICPTRQLCIQSEKQAWRCLKRAIYIIPGSLMGGESVKKQKARLRKGINILFSTPGRLNYHIQNTQSFKFSNLSCLVFDEADKTLDMGYRKELNSIFNVIREKVSDFELIQKILVSAHFNEKIEDLLDNLSPANLQYVGFNPNDKTPTTTKPSTFDKEINISKQLKQTFVLVGEQQRIPFLLAYLSLLSNCQILIFLSTIDEVEYFQFLLTNLYYRDSNGQYTDDRLQPRPVYKLHGNIDQKIRSQTYFSFRNSHNSILISTQVASRGLDFPQLTHIVLFDIPPTVTDYANRIGRTARMNSSGISLLILNYPQSAYIQQLKVYTPTITPIQKDVVFQSYSKILHQMKITSPVLGYLQWLIRGLVKDDQEKYGLARRAYVSMLRAYARLPKQVFKVKQLNLKNLAKSFGLNSVKSKEENARKAKNVQEMDHERARRRRKVEDVRKLQVEEYM